MYKNWNIEASILHYIQVIKIWLNEIQHYLISISILEWRKFFEYDIALITLKNKFRISPKKSVNPICLPIYTRRYSEQEPYIHLCKVWSSVSFTFIGNSLQYDMFWNNFWHAMCGKVYHLHIYLVGNGYDIQALKTNWYYW